VSKTDEKLDLKLPDIEKAFIELHNAVFLDGKLTVKQKELMAVGISVAIRCSPCIRVHLSKAIEAGALKEGILKTASVALLIGGGPAIPYVRELIELLEG